MGRGPLQVNHSSSTKTSAPKASLTDRSQTGAYVSYWFAGVMENAKQTKPTALSLSLQGEPFSAEPLEEPELSQEGLHVSPPEGSSEGQGVRVSSGTLTLLNLCECVCFFFFSF